MRGTTPEIVSELLRITVGFESSVLCNLLILVIDDEPGLLKHPRIFMLAGQLGLNELKALAHKRFRLELQEDWRVEDLVDCIEEVYLNENQSCCELKTTILEVALTYLLQRPVANIFVQVLREVNELRIDLMNLLGKD